MINTSPYNGSLTREQFLFFETRTVAKLMSQGLSDSEIENQIAQDNLFQCPTEKTITRVARACIRRLHALGDESLITAIAEQPAEVAKQICLYAMMKQYRLVWDFMISVIGNKYQQQDLKFNRSDVNVFFIRLQEQDDVVASWSESTVERIKQVLLRVLVENEYIDSNRANHLNPVMICSIFENAIRNNNDTIALPAFNCFW